MTEVPVARRHLCGMTISATRYALGCSTYIVGLTCAWVRAYWRDLDDNTRSVLLRDLRDGLRRPDSLGHDCDLREWRALLEWMEAQREK